ncbi:MAG: TolC family protein [Thermodesulfobacteriota bacterium]
MKLPAVIFLMLIFSILAGTAHAGEPLPQENLSALIETALINNPELKSSEARWRMFVNRARQAGALEDPMLMIKLQNLVTRDPLVFDKDPQTAKVIGISQQIPFFGKRAIRQEVAGHEAESYRWALEERRLELGRMVKETYYQLYGVDRALMVIAKNLGLLDDLKSIAETRYSVGQGTQQDILKASLEKSRMFDMQISLQQQRQSLAATLNSLLARPPATQVGGIADFALPPLPLSAEQLTVTAQENRPQLKSLERLADKGKASRRLAEKEFYPDFTLSLEYMARQEAMDDPGYDMVNAGITVNLPLQRERRQAMLDEASSETRMAMEEMNILRNGIALAVHDTLAQLSRRRKLVELYRDAIIPQAEQALESALIGYRVGKVDFPAVLENRMTLFSYERELYDSQTEYMVKLAQLEAVTGAGLPAEDHTRHH